MFYEERQIDGEWYHRTTPRGEWLKGRWDFFAAQPEGATNGQE